MLSLNLVHSNNSKETTLRLLVAVFTVFSAFALPVFLVPNASVAADVLSILQVVGQLPQ